jgi:hypothetical protein
VNGWLTEAHPTTRSLNSEHNLIRISSELEGWCDPPLIHGRHLRSCLVDAANSGLHFSQSLDFPNAASALHLGGRAKEVPRHCADLGEISRDVVFAATFTGDQMEAAVHEGLGRGWTTEMDHCGQRLLLLLVAGRVRPACKNDRDVAVQKYRRELDGVARHDAGYKAR